MRHCYRLSYIYIINQMYIWLPNGHIHSIARDLILFRLSTGVFMKRCISMRCGGTWGNVYITHCLVLTVRDWYYRCGHFLLHLYLYNTRRTVHVIRVEDEFQFVLYWYSSARNRNFCFRLRKLMGFYPITYHPLFVYIMIQNFQEW